MDEKKKKYSSNLISPESLAYLLIEFERHLVFERLNPPFLKDRNDWIANLLDCELFEDAIPSIEKLSLAIREPPFFTLAMKALSEESDLLRDAPLELCFLIMEYVVDVSNISDFCKSTVLHPSHLPIFDATKFGTLVSQISTFGNSTKELAIEFADNLRNLDKMSKKEFKKLTVGGTGAQMDEKKDSSDSEEEEKKEEQKQGEEPGPDQGPDQEPKENEGGKDQPQPQPQQPGNDIDLSFDVNLPYDIPPMNEEEVQEEVQEVEEDQSLTFITYQ